LKALGIANAVKEQVDQNKENQRILAQATVEANDKIDQLEKQIAQLYAALMAKQPQQQTPLQDTTTATNKALTDKINRLENASGGRQNSGRGSGYRSRGSNNFPRNNDGVRTTRRWDNDNYCWTCGYDIKHTSNNCKYIKDTTNHKKEATATNTMGGSNRNLHLRP
jgi:hypothetical protein